jgi:hypothetical protein
MIRFEQALEQCLDEIAAGRLDVDACLARFPEHAAKLRPHLIAAATVAARAGAIAPDAAFAERARERFLVASGERLAQTLGAVEPEPAFAERARERFMIASGQRLREAYDIEPSPSFFASARVKLLMAAHKLRKERTAPAQSRPWHGRTAARFAAAGAAALVMLIGASTYTVAEAASALPGDFLYPVKLETERVRLALAFGEDAKRDVRLELAEERGEEIERLAQKGRIIGPGELDRLTKQTEPLIEAAGDGDWDTNDLAKLQAVTQKQKTLLQEVAPHVQPGAEEQLAKAQEVSRTGVIVASGAIARNPETPPQVVTPSVRLAGEDETPTDTPQATPTATTTGTPDGSTTATSSPEATATSADSLTVDRTPLGEGLGVTWVRLAVADLTALIPSPEDGWHIAGINVAAGPAPAPTLVRLSNRDGTSLITLNPRNGDMYWFIVRGGVFDEIQMRVAQSDGSILVVDRDVIFAAYGSAAEIPLYVMQSIRVAPRPTE